MTVNELDDRIRQIEAIREPFAALHARWRQRLDELLHLPGRPDRDRPYAIEEARQTIRQIADGVDRSESIVPELWALASPLFDVFVRPGLARFDRELANLRELRQQESARVERWPTSETTHPYRLVRGRHCVGDRDLAVGEVLALNERQATAWGDLFEPVEEIAPPTEPHIDAGTRFTGHEAAT